MKAAVMTEDDMLPSERVAAAQGEVPPLITARMIHDFMTHFASTYPNSVMTSSLCAVGPLQSMIGLAIKNGLLSVPPKPESP